MHEGQIIAGAYWYAAKAVSDGLFSTARCKGRLLVRRKRRAYEKGHPAAADGISEPDRPLFPGFGHGEIINHPALLVSEMEHFLADGETVADAQQNQESEIQ